MSSRSSWPPRLRGRLMQATSVPPRTRRTRRRAVAAGALRGTLSAHALRAAFAAGLDAASVAAGVTATAAGALVLVLVRTPRPAPDAAGAPAREVAARRG
ncbi:hypothetical protein [Streptomyces avermitilis]|uniref:hypothetical protein n=1 Tax=Streptomyces avermitilis TaxID=33903 RepID=UPI00382147CF